LNNNYISEIDLFENENVEEVIFELENNELEDANNFFEEVK
jgi:hypothetical protein